MVINFCGVKENGTKPSVCKARNKSFFKAYVYDSSIFVMDKLQLGSAVVLTNAGEI